MPQRKRSNNRTMATVYRTYRLDESTRLAMKERRMRDGQTVAEFLTQAIDNHLPGIIDQLLQAGVPAVVDRSARPARLPMSDPLVEKLRQGSEKTGVPTTRLLVAAIQRAANVES